MAATVEENVRAPARRLRTHGREIRDASEELARSARATLDDVTLAWRLHLERNPYVSIGAVFVAGYVLGGGLPLGAARFALGVGARMAATIAIREIVSGSATRRRRNQSRAATRTSDPARRRSSARA